MGQAIKRSIQYFLSQEIIDQFLAYQEKDSIIRSVCDTAEAVEYLPDSTLRFWYNNTLTPYESHWHTACEMIIPVEGNYLVTVGQKNWELSPGDIFLIPGGELHTLRSPSRGGRFIFLFDLDFVWRIKGSAYLASCVSAPLLINRSTCPSIYDEEAAIVRQLCLEYLQSDSLRDVAVYTQLLTFLLNYGKHRMSMDDAPSLTQSYHTAQKHYAEKFNAVFDYLDRHFAEELTLENVAAVAGFSKFHFSRTFKQLSGYNFYDYLCHRRIKSSEALLMTPGLSVSQIALQSGFSSVSTFNRTFKKLKGCTPTQYRDMFQVQNAKYRIK